MTRGRKSTLAAAGLVVASLLVAGRAAVAQVSLLNDAGGWQLTTDGRVNSFISVATGSGLPNEPDLPGAGTNDTPDANNGLHSTRIRNGFMMSILGFTGQKEISPNFKVTTRVGLWMNISGSRTKDISALVDPRELYGKIEGGWGSFLAGSDMALFGRGGILVDYRIAHNYGLGYPCGIRDASAGACGMVGFGAPFPGFEPGFVYATPSLGGLQISVGIYDPGNNAYSQLNRSPLPRFEGEVRYNYAEKFRLFASGFWQVQEGTVTDNSDPTVVRQKNLHTNTWGGQAGAMLALGPIMVGGAAYQGAGLSPFTHAAESQTAADTTGTLRKSRGAFGLAAILLNALRLKVAGGLGVTQVDKNKNDAPVGSPGMPTVLKQNLGMTAGVYHTTGPVHFALEYFRAQHTWHARGVANPVDPLVIDAVVNPQQVVHFVNAGMTVAW